MTILLLGATGRTGKLTMDVALRQGHYVHCLVRDKNQVADHNNLEVFQGDVSSTEDLARAI